MLRFDTNKDNGAINKIIAGYHQFNAVRNTIQKQLLPSITIDVLGLCGILQDQENHLVWFSMRVMLHKKELENPTIIVLTDRNDLDEQLLTNLVVALSFYAKIPSKLRVEKNSEKN